jgi:cystathionine beta-lyase/cystathionine gamma-synthase
MEREDSGVKDNLIRIAVGLEDIDDIIRDLNYLSN